MRTKVFSLLLIFCLMFLMYGLFQTQVVRYERFKMMSEENRLKVVPLMAPRGSIYDRNGNVMVKDVISFDVAVIYSRLDNSEELADMLSEVLEIPREKIASQIKKTRRRPFSPTVIVEDIGIDKAVHLEEIELDYPGLLLEVSARRKYISGTTGSNTLGYLGLINRSEFEKMKHYGYSISDMVGRSGIEKEYDNYLRGTHGGKQMEVDHRGRQVSTLGYKEPTPGRDLELTIDLELQRYCDKLLEGKRGSIVVMNPNTGAIVAMASAPSFDPEVFVDRNRKGEISDVLNDEEYPLMNRAISGAYPPGSIFKVVTAIAALESGAADEEKMFYCPGSVTLGSRTFHCWKESGHGDQNMREALKNSCNVYFWKLGLLLGVDNVAEYAGKFGVGSTTGIDLPGESSGVLPSREWKRKRLNQKWYRGETLNYVIGQGYLLCTPLQLARLMAVFANGGYLVQPYLVEEVGGVKVHEPVKEDLGIDPESIQVVREGLRKVVNDRRGTGQKARLDNVIVSGKTGTAQTSRGKNHGWFAGFAPYVTSDLVVVVFDEYGGKGGYYAAGTAGDVFKKAEELGLLADNAKDRSLSDEVE